MTNKENYNNGNMHGLKVCFETIVTVRIMGGSVRIC